MIQDYPAPGYLQSGQAKRNPKTLSGAGTTSEVPTGQGLPWKPGSPGTTEGKAASGCENRATDPS